MYTTLRRARRIYRHVERLFSVEHLPGQLNGNINRMRKRIDRLHTKGIVDERVRSIGIIEIHLVGRIVIAVFTIFAIVIDVAACRQTHQGRAGQQRMSECCSHNDCLFLTVGKITYCHIRSHVQAKAV